VVLISACASRDVANPPSTVSVTPSPPSWAVAVTFGAGCHYGHGVYVRPGSSSFALNRYAIE
jgi:hypothetical protein